MSIDFYPELRNKYIVLFKAVVSNKEGIFLDVIKIHFATNCCLGIIYHIIKNFQLID